MTVNSEDQLRALYGFPQGRARQKQLSRLETHCLNFIRLSPFVIISTSNAAGQLDVSPRGGRPGFVLAQDENHLVIPDAKGNKRLDSLVNIIETGRVGLLFLIPGIDETLRVNGSATVTADANLLQRFTEERHPPKTCLVVEVEEAFLHCAKALMRSRLWAQDARQDRKALPTMGQMLHDQLGIDTEPETQEAMIARYQGDL